MLCPSAIYFHLFMYHPMSTSSALLRLFQQRMTPNYSGSCCGAKHTLAGLGGRLEYVSRSDKPSSQPACPPVLCLHRDRDTSSSELP